MSNHQAERVPFRHRKLWGIPFPIFVGILAVLLVASAAIAAIIATVRTRVDGNIVNSDVVWYDGFVVEGKDGIGSVSINGLGETGTLPGPTELLQVAINNAMTQGSFYMCAKFIVPQDVSGQFNVQGIDFGNTDTLTAELSSDYCETPGFTANTTGAILRDPVIAPNLSGGLTHSTHPELVPAGYELYMVRINVSILESATVGPFGGFETDGLILTTA